MSSSHYTHGTSPAEQQRLTAMNHLLNERFLAQAALAPGERIVDFGAGLGQFSRAMAKVIGMPVVGIERSNEQILEAMRQADAAGETHLIDMRQGNAEIAPLTDGEWGHFDMAHARFLLEHVSNPLFIVRTMVRAVRPGGRIILADDDHEVMRLWPEPPGLAPVWHAYQRTCDRHGNDPIVGRRLVQLLHQAGACYSAWGPQAPVVGVSARSVPDYTFSSNGSETIPRWACGLTLNVKLDATHIGLVPI
jgi:SAM-dependent methyltransferase